MVAGGSDDDAAVQQRLGTAAGTGASDGDVLLFGGKLEERGAHHEHACVVAFPVRGIRNCG